jgi:PAS domain S-box-containing protein
MTQKPTINNQPAFASVFNHASIGIIISDVNGVIQRINLHANKLFGYRDDELIGQKIEVLVPASARSKHVGHREHYNQDAKPRSMGMGLSLFAVRKDGTQFPVEIGLTRYEAQGTKEVVSFISDITERQRTEEEMKRLNADLESQVKERTKELSQAIMELQHTNENLLSEMQQRQAAEQEVIKALDKEKELNELKSRFVSMASHEFRTPLSGILTSVSLIARYEAAADTEKRHKHIQTIKNSVHSLTNILNDFLSLDKLETGLLSCKPSIFDLQDYCKDLVSEMETHIKKGQSILYEHQGGDPQVKLDKDILRNVFLNLLSNAIKYSSENSVIRFTTRLRGDDIVMIVQDNGIGIPQNDQKHLFERFFRASNASATQGTGLGLNIIKRYLELMSGTIDFVSKENAGTTFTIVLPREVTS